MKISRKSLKADGLLFIAAIIWGMAFSAQRSGMQSIGPFGYNAVRFLIGALTVLPLLLVMRRRPASAPANDPRPGFPKKLLYSTLVGLALFCGTSFQQAGLVSTTAGHASFITALYVVLVPIVGIAFGRRSNLLMWLGAILALIGLYTLAVPGDFKISGGDILEFVGALFWTLHILVISRYGSKMDGIELAFGQYLVCSLLCLVSALIVEPHPFDGVAAAAVPILYGGICSAGIGFTLQVVAQKNAHPAHASIIMSLESLFGAIGGIILLGEPLTISLAFGGVMMLAGTIVSQLEFAPRRRAKAA